VINTAKSAPARTAKKEISREAKRLAAIILDVLAGSRTPAQAAEGLGLSLPRYYQLEARGVDGLLAACEPRPRGRQVVVGSQEESLRRDNERLRRELSRQQSLVRLTQRTIGVTPPPPAKAGGKRKPRRATVRAMRRAEDLRDETKAGSLDSVGAGEAE
jgi:hypothetical protein